MAELFLGAIVDAATHERQTDEVRLDADDLTTHGVIVGMTGSGKTGLGVVLVEEVLSAGLPALLIDPKGDLTNLALLFPGLSAAEFRPWIDDGAAKAAGVEPDEFAAQQATMWSESLAGWGITGERLGTLRDSVDVTIYTPGSRAGLPLDIVGSLQVPADTSDAEVVGDEIEGYVSGLLGLVGIDADPLSSREHILLSNLVQHSWSEGRSLDLPTLVAVVQQPPIRKLGVFELDQFFPPDDRTALALRLNGLLASPSFAAWSDGPPLDIQSMLFGADGRPRCAVVTTSHLSDEERQFVTALLLSKLVTWTRRQSGTSDLRALLYMDEVMGYLPPTENPPTKKPILTLMKQARAFGVGVVLATQNPVDVDYKALSNAGTWMVGRLQTERDKSRLLEGMSAAAGGVDLGAVSDTISGLAKREFVLRRAGSDRPEVFTSRWAMSYLRGPLTRDQIAELMESRRIDTEAEPAVPAEGDAASPVPEATSSAPGAETAATTPPMSTPSADATPVMPQPAEGIAVRWVDAAAPWLTAVGGDPTGTVREAAISARVRLRYDETKADLVHDAEYEAVLFPLTAQPDPAKAIAADVDDRDLVTEPPTNCTYRIGDAPIDTSTFWKRAEKAFVDHVARSLTLEIPVNTELKVYGRPGETAEAFAARCAQTADDRADAEIAKLRDKYEAKAAALKTRIDAAEDRADIVAEQAQGRSRGEMMSTAGSILGGMLGGRSSRGGLMGTIGRAMGRRSRASADSERVDEARNKVGRLEQDLAEVEAELAEEVTEIDTRWGASAATVTTMSIALERTDVEVAELVLAWVPTT